MSYLLAVWEGDEPPDEAAFLKLHERCARSKERQEPTARIAEYVRALLDRFPDIGTDEGEDSPWAASPLMGEAHGPLLYLPITLGWGDAVSAWAVQLAGAHGLHCYDPQLQQVRLPAAESPEPIVDMRAVRDAAVLRLTGLMLDRGWQVADASHDTTGIAQLQPSGLVFTLRLNRSTGSGGVTINPVVSAGHLELGRLYTAFMGLEPEEGLGVALGTAAGLQDLLAADGILGASWTRWTIESEDRVDADIDVLLSDFDTYGMPFLERFTTLRDVIERMRARRGHHERAMLAVACALDGRKSEAIAALEDYARDGAGQRGLMLQQTTGFVQRFVAHFGIGAVM